MIPLVYGLAIGTGIGALASTLARKLRDRRSAHRPEHIDPEEHDDLEANFAAHIASMRSQVSDFADKLAGDDPLLRERLRVFEGGDLP
ncbi:MAG: hypothetical protein NTV28_01200 [Propionibacteriales bacterium]|nr:hypothetical protein [Propionibacteriales bacterium]